MINILKEYYGLEVEYYKNYRDGIVFFVNGDYYYFFKTILSSRDISKLYDLYSLIKSRNIVLHDFVFNNNGEILSKEYVLIKLNYLIDEITLSDIKKLNIVSNTFFIKS